MRFSEMTAQRSWKRFSETVKKVSGKKQRLFRLGKALVISVLAAQDLQPLADALSVVRAQPIAQKRVDRQVEKVRELHQHRDLRKALPRLP